MVSPTGQPSTSATTGSSPCSSASDSRYVRPPTSTSNRWILRYVAIELALGVEDEARVRELLAALAALGDRAADERDPVRVRPAAHRLDRLAALDRLGGLVQHVRRADHVPLLGEADDVRAGRRRLSDELLRLLEVRGLLSAARQLHAGDANSIGHGAEDSPRI